MIRPFIILLALAGCASEPPAQHVSGPQSLDIVDKHNWHYGTIEMTPSGGGRVYDSDGQLIGEIISAQN